MEWLYKPRTMKDIKDGIYDTVRTSFGRVRLRSDAESGSGTHYRDEIIARQEREIADLRRALAARGTASTGDTAAFTPRPSMVPMPTGVGVGSSRDVRAQTTAPAVEHD
ncbi:hypothetical protein AAF712_009266 [Marasmius tenuissimus]|uniref:Uncharacterized protein n=1 Tax=Marasmius tenuissimus TaxID=585030 RepID=A0ABR2ZQG6_9AGAR